MANYIFTRAHDTEAQTIIQRIIRDRINPNLFGYNFTRDEIKKAFEIYNVGYQYSSQDLCVIQLAICLCPHVDQQGLYNTCLLR